MRFESLREDLLRAGVAPRRVRRYLRELENHLSDLTEQEIAAGNDHATAADRARALLGSDAELAEAWLREPKFKSLTARAPWLVFGLLPPLALLLGAFLQIILFVTMAHLLGIIGLGPHAATAPQRFWSLVAVMQVVGNFVVIPAITLPFVVLARHQRLPLLWPVLSTLLIASLSLHWDQQPWSIDPHGWGAVGLAYRYGGSGNAVRFAFTPVFLYAWWKALPVHGLTLAAQYLLTLLPLAGLVRHRRKIVVPA